MLYICGSNRNGNCYQMIEDLKEEKDHVVLLSEKAICSCLGCNTCKDQVDGLCIMEDDMQEIYQEIQQNDRIILVTPIYMNHITGLLKNMIDRLNPFSWHDEFLKGKKVYIITVGQMQEEENQEVADNIKEYFESLAEFMNFESIFLRNFTSGDIEEVDDVTKMYSNYKEIIQDLKNKIKQ